MYNSSNNDYSGCHSYVSEPIESKNPNYIIESSISKSKGDAACVTLDYGDQLIDSTNISYAKCIISTAYICYSPTTHNINFTTIFNNTVDEQCVMYHGFNNQSVSYCNVINNIHKKVDENYGIVGHFGNDFLEISFCSFASNSGPSYFYKYNNYYGNFIVKQCFLDNSNHVDTITTGSVSLATTNSLSFEIPIFSSQYCMADFYSIKTVKYEKTYGNNPYHNRRMFRMKQR